MTDTALKDGRIVGIAGPVIDAEFPQGELPEINTAIEFDVVIDGATITIVAEVAQQIGNSRVRAIAMKPTDGLTRGTTVHNTGQGISVPVGDATLGHVFNVTGQGQQRGIEVFTGRGAALTHRSSLPKTLLVTVVPEEQKEQVLETIIASALSSEEGTVGDGKIFVSAIAEVIRVRTGERDLAALTAGEDE